MAAAILKGDGVRLFIDRVLIKEVGCCLAGHLERHGRLAGAAAARLEHAAFKAAERLAHGAN